MPGLELSPETAAKTFDLFKLLFAASWGITLLIIFFHASYNEQGVYFWAMFTIIIPGVGYLIMDKYLKGQTEFTLIFPIAVLVVYFMFYLMGGVERAARRARVRAEQRWEFELTNKGMRKDPNAPGGESDYTKPPHPGHRREVMAESPPSREGEELDRPGHIKDVIDESPLSRIIEPKDEASQEGSSAPHRLKKIIDESPPSRDVDIDEGGE
jgi:hypothetical protein